MMMMADLGSRDLYADLGCEPSAPQDALRAAYYRIALEKHPDRRGRGDDGDGDGGDGDGDGRDGAFIRAQRAWEVLRDPDARAAYDAARAHAALASFRPTDGEVDLDDMEAVDDGHAFVHTCRCGGEFRVTVDELERNVDVLACSTCSFHIRVLYARAHD